jgi:hypothetical protein
VKRPDDDNEYSLAPDTVRARTWYRKAADAAEPIAPRRTLRDRLFSLVKMKEP